MLQNPSTNKLSSFIGIILLLFVIGFTVFINFFTEKPVETEILKEAAEEKYFRPFDENDLENLWKLNHVYTDSVIRDVEKEVTYMKIYKNDTTASNLISKLESTPYYGTISLNTINYNIIDTYIPYDENVPFEGSSLIPNGREEDLKKIVFLILEYEIASIITQSEAGDFTHIKFKDGRSLFLIKENAEIIDQYYKELLENAESLNDSTRIIYHEY